MKKMNLVKYSAPVLMTVASVGAQAAEGSGASTIFAAVDFSGYAAFIAGAGVTIIGIAMALKAVTVGKRAVNKA